MILTIELADFPRFEYDLTDSDGNVIMSSN